MDLIHKAIHFVLHIDQELKPLVDEYGLWIYLLLFLIVFCETGLVVTPFLPGDSLLFACGALAAQGLLRLEIFMPLLFLAAFLGDNVNWFVGNRFGSWLIERKWFRKDYLEQTKEFFTKHGGKAVVMARFAPIVRTFAPFTAGLGAMAYPRFIKYSLLASTLWILGFSFAGYLLANTPIIRDNIKLVFLLIIGFSLLPIVIGAWKGRRAVRERAASAKLSGEPPESP